MTFHALPPALAMAHQLLADLAVPFWIAGGWALDLHLGEQSRRHGDVDVLIRAADADIVAASLSATPLVQHPRTSQTRPWVRGEVLTPGPDVLFLPHTEPCPVQVLLAASDGDDWVYHRGSGRVRKPWLEITRTTAGLPHLTPEIVLLFKAQELRDRDHVDFAAVRNHLTTDQRAWLAERIRPRFPDHPWLTDLSARGPDDAPPRRGRG